MQGFIVDLSKTSLKYQNHCPILSKKMFLFSFTEGCVESFNVLKNALISAPIIQPPDWNLPFEIMCDASDYVVGAVLG
jgi:hypothetical protein